MADFDIKAVIGTELFTTQFDSAKLAAFSMTQLRDVREGAKLVADMVIGLIEQPRYSRSGTYTYNCAGEALDLLRDVALGIADASEDEACRRKDAEGHDAKVRAWILIRARAEREDDDEGELGALLKAVTADALDGRA